MTIKLCIDCKWCTFDKPPENEYDEPYCENPECNQPNLMWGGFHYSTCRQQRYLADGQCGKEGTHWEARE